MKIVIKRAYEPAEKSDGYRVLVDRLWPRGVKKENLALDEWCKDIAPSTELREWFKHDPEKFKEFTVRYEHELKKSKVPQELLERAGKAATITLIYAAHDTEHNHAKVLQAYLEDLV
jgi:uncharacterized protein YeaO (DUF488 family)